MRRRPSSTETATIGSYWFYLTKAEADAIAYDLRPRRNGAWLPSSLEHGCLRHWKERFTLDADNFEHCRRLRDRGDLFLCYAVFLDCYEAQDPLHQEAKSLGAALKEFKAAKGVYPIIPDRSTVNLKNELVGGGYLR
jgi:hypothetical protein